MKSRTARFISAGLLLALILWPFQAGAQAVIEQKLAQAIDQEIEKNLVEMIKVRRFLHMNPELSNFEFETAKLVASRLTSLGLEVKIGVAGSGVVGLLRGAWPGPTVAIRADLDALPIQELNTLSLTVRLTLELCTPAGHDFHTDHSSGDGHGFIKGQGQNPGQC